jgi:hypothetical protein
MFAGAVHCSSKLFISSRWVLFSRSVCTITKYKSKNKKKRIQLEKGKTIKGKKCEKKE